MRRLQRGLLHELVGAAAAPRRAPAVATRSRGRTGDRNAIRRSWTIYDHVNSLLCEDTYSATSNNIQLVHWPLMDGLLHLVQRGGDLAGPQPAPCRPLLAVPNVTSHPTTASLPIAVLMYNGPLLCGFNVPVNGLMSKLHSTRNISIFYASRLYVVRLWHVA